VSMFLRRSGARSRSLVTALAVFAVALALAVPAFGTTVKSVHIRIEGTNATLFSSTRTVGSTTIVDSIGVRHAIAANPIAALDLAAQLGAFPYVVKDGAWGLGVDSVNGELPVPVDPYPGWLFRINGVRPDVGADALSLAAGDDVLWYYGTWDASPTVAVPSKSLVNVGDSLVVSAKQLAPSGVRSTLAGAAVHVGSLVATSAANGTVSIPMTAVGDFGVRVDKPGFIRSAVTTVHVRKATAVKSLKASANYVEVGAVPVFSGVLTSGSAKLSGKHVRLWHRTKGHSTWVAGSTKVTGSTGVVRFSVRPQRSTYYRLAYSGSSTYAPVTSASKLVTIR